MARLRLVGREVGLRQCQHLAQLEVMGEPGEHSKDVGGEAGRNKWKNSSPFLLFKGTFTCLPSVIKFENFKC